MFHLKFYKNYTKDFIKYKSWEDKYEYTLKRSKCSFSEQLLSSIWDNGPRLNNNFHI
jgi:hypothetical protein